MHKKYRFAILDQLSKYNQFIQGALLYNYFILFMKNTSRDMWSLEVYLLKY